MKKYPFQNVPKGIANIEVEKGETIITPEGRVYNFPDGKKHKQGGIKILAKGGSWITSEHQKLKKEVAQKLMPLGKMPRKRRISVADLSRKYDTNPYFDMLSNKDNRLDSLRQKTAEFMIAKNVAHQGNILKAQEELKASKGMDNNLTKLDSNSFADNLAAKLGGKVGMKYRGKSVENMPKAQDGSYIDSLYPPLDLMSLVNQDSLQYYNGFQPGIVNTGVVTQQGMNEFFANNAPEPIVTITPQNNNNRGYQIAPGSVEDYMPMPAPFSNQSVQSNIPPTAPVPFGGNRRHAPPSNPPITTSGSPKKGTPGFPAGFGVDPNNQISLSLLKLNRGKDLSNLRGWGDSVFNLPKSQHQKGELFGGIDGLRPQHVAMFKFNTGRDPNSPQEVIDFMKSNIGEWDTDESKGVEMNKYGMRMHELPGKVLNLPGKKSGTVTLDEYLKDPNKVSTEYGVDRTTLDRSFQNSSNGDNAGTYFLDIHDRSVSDIKPIPMSEMKPLEVPNTNPDKLPVNITNPDKPVEKPAEEPKYEEKGIDHRRLVDGVQQGLLLSSLATLEKDVPYYSYSPVKAVYNRFDPVNTLSSERAFNIAKENLENSNLPENVKQAQLSDMQAKMQQQVTQVDMQNYQGNLQNNNKNNQILSNTLNQNLQMREQANKQYVVESARANELYNQQRHDIIDNMMNIWRTGQEYNYNKKLVNQMGRNYKLDSQGNVIFVKGQGTNPQFDQLSPFGGGDGSFGGNDPRSLTREAILKQLGY